LFHPQFEPLDEKSNSVQSEIVNGVLIAGAVG
jgi:hypothetical protein